MERAFKFSLFNLIFNIAYSAYHIALGSATRSWWLLTVGVYFVILSATRFCILGIKGKKRLVIRSSGILLIALSVPLCGTVILAVLQDRGIVFHEILMIGIAVYAFTKITIATVNLVKARGSASEKLLALRNISFADACVSIFALQRSMLVSFEGMTESEICIMNAATGSAVCFVVFLLGFNLIRKEKVAYQA